MSRDTELFIRLYPDDHVAVVREDIEEGRSLADGVSAAADIPAGHKIALRPVEQGGAVLKYGQPIGRASLPIRIGDHVHTHNLSAERTNGGASATSEYRSVHDPIERTFMGFRRKAGSVGTRNYIGVLTTVNCSATVARRISAHFSDEHLSAFPRVDGIVPITHTTGCGQSATGD
ncbi:MAG: UxaA family hydrolase, partial [Pseudomonadota bacterium]